jgi:hypothetical protein
MGRISITGSVMFSPVLKVSGDRFQLYFAQTNILEICFLEIGLQARRKNQKRELKSKKERQR